MFYIVVDDLILQSINYDETTHTVYEDKLNYISRTHTYWRNKSSKVFQ